MNGTWVSEVSLGAWILEGVKVLATAAITIYTLEDGQSLNAVGIGHGSVEEKKVKYNQDLIDRIKSIYNAFSVVDGTNDKEEEK